MCDSHLHFEPLENRALPAQLGSLAVSLLDGESSPIPAPAFGQEISVRAEWTTDGLSHDDRYVVRIDVDGVPLDSPLIAGEPGTALRQSFTAHGWFAGTGEHTVTVTLDPHDDIPESDESDNTHTLTFSAVPPADLPALFRPALAGVPGRDWAVINHADVDPRDGIAADFRGGPFQYDGHGALDLALPNFRRMDLGVPVLAAAGGTVTEVRDGLFDRHTRFNSAAPNVVAIDHGNGWSTRYVHAAAGSVAVEVGDSVAAGQVLALAGSSGSSTDAHLHFAVLHNGSLVETAFSPESYWLPGSEPAYPGDAEPAVTDSGVSDGPVADDVKERPSEVVTFPLTSGKPVHFWYRLTHLRPSDTGRVVWHRPDGSEALAFDVNTAEAQRGPFHAWDISPATYRGRPGVWSASLEVNGRVLAREEFTVGTSAEPELRLRDDAGGLIIDGRTTPIDFGQVPEGAQPPIRTFVVQNHGTAPLTLGTPAVPDGFELVGGFPSSVAPGEEASFTLAMTTAGVGLRWGEVRFATDDRDEGAFNFNLSGSVAGEFPQGTPALDVGLALVYDVGSGPAATAPRGTAADAGTADFDGGLLEVRFVAGARSGDVLALRSAGEVTVSGGGVFFSGTRVGTVTGGANLEPLRVAFGPSSTIDAVPAVLRGVTYSNPSETPVTRSRYLAYTLADGSGLRSDPAVQRVIFDQIREEQVTEPPPPVSPSDPFRWFAVGSDAGDPAEARVYGADPSSPTLTLRPDFGPAL